MKVQVWVVERNLEELAQWVNLFELGEIPITQPPLFHTYRPGANYVEVSISYNTYIALKDNERKE
jgi:hypothetical protein